MKIDKEGALIVLTKDKKALLTLRDNKPEINYPNLWSIPGGRVEEGETALEAVFREFKEETGYSLKNPILVHEEVFERKGENIKWDIFTEQYDGEQEINCYEGQKNEFVGIEKIEKLDLVPRTKEILIKILK